MKLDRRLPNNGPTVHQEARLLKLQSAPIHKKSRSTVTHIFTVVSPESFREHVQRLTGMDDCKETVARTRHRQKARVCGSSSKFAAEILREPLYGATTGAVPFGFFEENSCSVLSEHRVTELNSTLTFSLDIGAGPDQGSGDSASDDDKSEKSIKQLVNEQNRESDVCKPGESEKSSEVVQPEEVKYAASMKLASDDAPDIKYASPEAHACDELDSGLGELDSWCSESDVEDAKMPSRASQKLRKTDACGIFGVPSSTGSEEFHRPIERSVQAYLNLSVGSALIPYRSSRDFIMQGCLGLVEPPEVREWEIAKEICLMHNNLSELPENPKCYSLSTLFLQRNHRLRTIPASFFNHMPALEILNLSRTRIKSLPDSLFQLVNLKRLFLNECILLRSLSGKVGGLKNLEVLDLEGTKLMGLPEEIRHLAHLTCLEASILGSYGKTTRKSNPLIPSGIISALFQLEELNIGVEPDAEWWDSSVDGLVDEICSLKRLSVLKFYFPRVELLGKFKSLELSYFRLIVGKHTERIMSRLTADVEFELERWGRCLRYVNGDGFSEDLKKVIKQADAFFLDRHSNIENLGNVGNMERLKCCVLGECNKLQLLVDVEEAHKEGDGIYLSSLEYLYVYYMKNLESIWHGPVPHGSLSRLKYLTLRTCPKLITVFSLGLLESLSNLEELSVEDCSSMVRLTDDVADGGTSDNHYLPMLKKLSLHYLPELTSISGGLPVARNITWMSFYDCPNLKRLELPIENTERVQGQRSWWEGLEWNAERPVNLDDVFVPIDCSAIP